MMATFRGDVPLTAFFFNNLICTGPCNYPHSTYIMYSVSNGSGILTLVSLYSMYHFGKNHVIVTSLDLTTGYSR